MSRIFSVKKLLTDAQLEQFAAMAIDDRKTCDELHGWIVALGHRISRTAVGNFRARIRPRVAFPCAPLLRCESEAGKRRQIADWAMQLSGEPLIALLEFAAYQIDKQAAWANRPSEFLPRIEPENQSGRKG